jgi:predicted regulator of Ras-like GTPase activity (Roadblock/LC7/MglB family)
MLVVMSSDLSEVCDKLQRDAGCKKVMVCGAEGDVMAHAGTTGLLDDATADAIAALVADVIHGAARPQSPPVEDIVVTLQSTLQACAAPLGAQAALVVLFDGATSLDRVRTKMRRARSVLEKSLQTAAAGAEKTREPS